MAREEHVPRFHTAADDARQIYGEILKSILSAVQSWDEPIFQLECAILGVCG